MGISSSILIRFHENVILFLHKAAGKKGKTLSNDDSTFCNELLQKEGNIVENTKNKEIELFQNNLPCIS